MIEQMNDSDRAQMPMYDDSGLDDTILGLQIDLLNTNDVIAPCKVVEKSGPLPRLAVLSNRGQLLYWNIWYSAGIKKGECQLQTCVNNELERIQKSSSAEISNEPPQIKPTQKPASLFQQAPQQSQQQNQNPAAGLFNVSQQSKPFGQQSQQQSGSFGAFNKSASSFGAGSTTNTSTASPFGSGSTINASTASPFGSGSTTGATTNSGFGASTFGSTISTNTNSVFDSSPFGSASTTNANTNSGFGSSTFGSDSTTNANTNSAFGSSPFGSGSAINTNTNSGFGSSSFGQSGFGVAPASDAASTTNQFKMSSGGGFSAFADKSPFSSTTAASGSTFGAGAAGASINL
ncbi:unnamed protein product [Ambrosiozyma monospora]|uniref:Unnamed protein product n=1 Tax=Ambrosiozyma monospora TaxID=43982 RepID=A0ACB5T7M4_AMBMO|nr:unnamed protein product [Ambrosiozyma monospora]